ncbi:MAG: hypothetical protein Aurels2KO_49670 [Aureliella sp.]
MPAKQRRSRRLAAETLEDRRLLFNPTGAEQELLQLVNRFRSAPAAELNHMFTSISPLKAVDPFVQTNVDFFNTNGTTLRSEMQALQAAPPVAWNEHIYDFAKSHNSAMINSNPPRQFHSNVTTRRETLLSKGVNLRIVGGERINSENVFAYGSTPSQILASYVVDWGTGSGGMINGRGHRVALINDDFEQIGHAITPHSGGGLGPLFNTQVLANIENPPIMAVGALFEDMNSSKWYESGEGIGSATITFEGPAGTFSTTTMAAGGYQVELPPGTYKATASGGGMKHAVVVDSVTIGQTNEWLDLIYDPSAPPPDALESNNSRGTATELTGNDQTIRGLSIHTGSDVDYFKLVSEGTGAANVSIQFSHAAGNLSLRVLNSSGTAIATAGSSTDNESLSVNLTRGATYFVEVSSVGTAVNGNYTLTVAPPKPAAPVAVNDSSNANNALRSTSINVLANDSDPDGPITSATVSMQAGTHSAFSLEGSTVSYAAPVGCSGFHRARYRITDDQGLNSAYATVSIFVVDFEGETPWQNDAMHLDPNGDSVVAPNDVLMVVNELNARRARRLPTTPSGAGNLSGFVDTNGDGFVSPIDVLAIVNHLNAEGEGEMWSPDQSGGADAHDASLAELTYSPADFFPVSRNPWDDDDR